MSLFEERIEIRNDLIAGKVPKRMPIYVNFQLDAAVGLSGIDLVKAHYDPALMEQAYDKLCDTFYADSLPVVNMRYPSSYQALGSTNWVMGSSGSMQHPEVNSMEPEEYDAYTADPYGFMMETLMPRLCSALDTDPVNRSINLAKGYAAFNKAVADQGAVIGKLLKKHSYGPGIITGTMWTAPFDFVADQLRGFKGITMDVRRCPDKVEAAVNASVPILMKQATLARNKPGCYTFIPLHLAPYINTKQFERLFWPSLYKMVWDLHEIGIYCCLFAEEDWSRYADHLATLPKSSIIIFEYGDPAMFKEKVGKDRPIGGFFDPTMTLTKSKEDCLDAVKRLCDTLGPGGNAYFRFNKGVIDIKSINVGKLQACLEWVRDNTDYR